MDHVILLGADGNTTGQGQFNVLMEECPVFAELMGIYPLIFYCTVVCFLLEESVLTLLYCWRWWHQRG